MRNWTYAGAEAVLRLRAAVQDGSYAQLWQRRLGEKLLCCTLQFGYFNKGKFATLNAFLDRLEPFLAGWPADVPLAVEVRNKAWMTQALGDQAQQPGRPAEPMTALGRLGRPGLLQRLGRSGLATWDDHPLALK
jgi:hypothetical protein